MSIQPRLETGGPGHRGIVDLFRGSLSENGRLRIRILMKKGVVVRANDVKETSMRSPRMTRFSNGERYRSTLAGLVAAALLLLG